MHMRACVLQTDDKGRIAILAEKWTVKSLPETGNSGHNGDMSGTLHGH